MDPEGTQCDHCDETCEHHCAAGDASWQQKSLRAYYVLRRCGDVLCSRCVAHPMITAAGQLRLAGLDSLVDESPSGVGDSAAAAVAAGRGARAPPAACRPACTWELSRITWQSEREARFCDDSSNKHPANRCWHGRKCMREFSSIGASSCVSTARGARRDFARVRSSRRGIARRWRYLHNAHCR